ncbi:MAG: hypothetical protein Q9225_003906 [Loekoesia sp. 1 TL-2023]
MSGPHDLQAAASSTSPQASRSPGSSHSADKHVEAEDLTRDWESDHQYRHTISTTKSSISSHGVDGDNERRKQRARRSGGFLLQDITPTYTYNTRKRPLQHISNDPKGKGRAEDGDVVISKRASARRHRQKPSIGSSPLSTVVYNDADKSGPHRSQGHSSDQILPYHSESSTQGQEAPTVSPVNGRVLSDEGRYSDAQIPSAVGYNTDPAQIVNLALNLSESRRRNISGSRLSPVYFDRPRRQVSTEPNIVGPSTRHISIAGANLRRHLNDQRRISRTSASRSGADSWDSPSPKSNQSSNGGDQSFSSELHDPAVAQEVILKPSGATLARAERARFTFELSYEYRRLLQYLPKLPSAAHSRQSSSKAANGLEAFSPDSFGRTYDPLQYIRNRKVRGRERKHLDAEAEGWKDLDRVKLWVDRVASEYQATGLSVDHKNRLPDLDSIQLDSQIAQGSPSSNNLMSTDARPSKSERQNSGWAFTPWDLLADAAWLDRDGNIKLVEDSKGNKLLLNPQLPKQSTPRTSLEQARPSDKRSLSLSRSVAPEEERSVNVSSQSKRKRNLSHIRGKSYEATSPLKDHEGPRERKGRWHRNFIRSRSPSSSGSSLTDGAHGYAWAKHHDREGLDSVALEKQMMELLAKEIDNDPFSTSTETEPATQLASEHNADEERQIDEMVARPEELARSPERNSQKDTLARSQMPERSSVEERRGRRPRTSFDNLDDTAPNSPSTFHFGPSIFINRSAPNSRSVSPKNPLTSRLRLSRHSRSHSRPSVSDHDFAVTAGSPVKPARQRISDSDSREANQRTRKSDSNTNLLSPITAELFGKRFRRINDSSTSIKAGRDSKDPDSRFRGLLKGTRIAELVGNEVTRVGDMIWRRDGSNLSRTASPVSARAVGDSDTEGEYSTLENSPETDLSRATTNVDGGTLSRRSTRSSQPRYHHPNLPTFRSSISQASPGSPKASSPEDHPITRQQMAQKARGRSSRFDRLAPPRIDMRSVSPSASPPLSRVQTNDTSNISRDPSTSRSKHRVRSADRRLNDVLGIPGAVRNVVTPTGLTNLSSSTTKPHNSNRRPPEDRKWSISDRSVSNTRGGNITKRDIARVRALLLSSGIKANEIARQANTINDPPFLSQLRELHERCEKPIPKVARAQEHLLTAKLIVAEIDSTNQAIRDKAESFSNETAEDLHQKFKELDERVSGTLVPRVRASADDADALSMELTTTHTLSVKRLTDGVEALLRRRRRRGRWVRRGAYVILEWMLLGIMWMVWLVVVVVRLARGVVRGMVGVVRWMLWL